MGRGREYVEIGGLPRLPHLGGTLDLVATVRGGRRLLLDWKTGETGIYPKDALQLATYRRATHIQHLETKGSEPGSTDEPMPKVDGAAVCGSGQTFTKSARS